MRIAENIILIGGSAGSYNLILDIIESIPPIVSTAICIVMHRNASANSYIEDELSNKYNRPILTIEDKFEIKENHIYFSPAGYHTLVEPTFTFSLDISEEVNFSIPSIDILFETCAQIYKSNCTAFLLSGANCDGAKGIQIIENYKGSTYIQSPKESIIRVMPESAIELSKKSTILTNQEIINFFHLLA